MFVFGILIHVTFLFSIFDIYFKSPIVRNVDPYQPQHDQLADRLVLFVVDGLRAESFVNYTTMPYLRSVANSVGRWGISQTQVPTESRPGHVAVIAGFYEDPSAIAKGWKENPVDFDSVFNQTSYTWCWGTYDIVNIFTKANVDDHIIVHDFDPYDQSFSTDKNTTFLDAWVFDNVKQFFDKANHDDNIKKKLFGNKIVFFLHLLGTDTAGHTHKPRTLNFLTTLSHVDQGIQEMEKIIRDFYGDDGRTTFLMTSDHGMTDWGSHGAGDDHETKTPYVIWGSGVNNPGEFKLDPETKGMSMENRLDINQVDLAPLMSTVLSIPVPVNSKGKLTSELLNMTLSNKAKAIYSNSRQLASQYNKKRLDVEENAISYLHKPYTPLSKAKYEEFIKFTEKLLYEEEYEKLIMMSEEIINLSISGLQYYHNYYQQQLLILVTLAFLGWIACLFKVLSEQKLFTAPGTSLKSFDLPKSALFRFNFMNIMFSCLCLIAVYLIHAQHLPVQYHLYSLMPIFLWWYALSSSNGYKQFQKHRNIFVLLLQILLYTLGSLALGLSFTYRWMLSVPLLGMGLWPFMSSARRQLTKPVLIMWPISCLLLSIFSFMPVVGKSVYIEQVITAGVIWLLAIIFYIQKIVLPLFHSKNETKREVVLTAIQAILLVLSLQNIYVQSKRFEEGTAVSHFYQTLSWFTAGTSLVLPLTFSQRLVLRLIAIHTSLLNIYLLLSVSHEGLFIVTLIFNLLCWIYIEFRLLHVRTFKLIEASFEKDDNQGRKSVITTERELTSQDFRRAFFFVLYIILAFFGTGNIASLNSFEVRWVTCFITSFQPFVITALVLLKTIAPFLSVACSFRAVQYLTKAPTGYLIIIVLIYSNIMGIQLLYNVKNIGSWLEIGTSISQFVIVQVITLFIVIINQIAKLLTDISIHNFADKLFKSRKKYV